MQSDFLRHLEAERRMSPRTVAGYQRDLHTLFAQMGELNLEALTPQHVRRFVAQLHAGGLSGRTLARLLSGWRSFFDYLGRHHHFAGNPCAGIRPPRSPKRLPHALSPDMAVHLVGLAGEDFLARRDRAMLELFYSSGLRLSELAGLRMEDLDLQEHLVRVTGKGNKTRQVPVGHAAREALAHWLESRKTLAAAPLPPLLFLTHCGRPLGIRGIQQRVALRARQQGLTDRVHPHVLRHSFASHVLQSSGDLRAVQEMLGHASITSTQVYTHLDFQHLARIYDAAHPRARRKGK